MHKKVQTMAGIGVFKGKSLCLNEEEVLKVHERFLMLYKNKVKKDQNEKKSRHS